MNVPMVLNQSIAATASPQAGRLYPLTMQYYQNQGASSGLKTSFRKASSIRNLQLCHLAKRTAKVFLDLPNICLDIEGSTREYAIQMNPGVQRTLSKSVMQRWLRRCAVWLTVLPVLASSFAQAQQTLDIKLLQGGTTIGEWHPAIINTGSGYMVNDVTYNPVGVTMHCYNMTVGFDPFISASVNVVNNTASIQNYTLIFTLPISPAVVGGSRIGGSTQGGVTDANFDGIGTLSTVGPGTALYNGQIDGVNVFPLLPHLTTVNAPFAGGSASISANSGLPGPTIPGPNALISIGIEHQFSLTPGDPATFTSFFVVQDVPEPGSLGLLAMGGLILLWRRRR
jgi:PEP-CTERM motif